MRATPSGPSGNVSDVPGATLSEWLHADEVLDDKVALDRRSALVLAEVSHRRDRTTALFRDGEAEFAVVRRRGTEPSIESWWLPNDPHLPALGRLTAVVSRLLADAGAPTEHPVMHRVSYKPGQRAVFTVEKRRGQPGWVVKALKPVKSVAIADHARALAAAGVGGAARAPEIVGDDGVYGTLLFTFVSGTSLKDLPSSHRTTALRDAVIAAAGHVHQGTSSALPAWDVDAYLDPVRQLVDDAGTTLGEPDALRATFDTLSRGLRSNASEGRLIHGDLTLRNIVVDVDSQIGFIDWDDASIGPVERDLATLSAAFGGQSAVGDVVATYRRSAALPTDESLVQHYVASQQLRKLCRNIIGAANPSN